METLRESTINQELLHFLDESPNSFFAVRNMAEMLEAHGYVRLYEGEDWLIQGGGRYYVTRNDSALIAFHLPEGPLAGFQIMASHCDSPVFKIKPNAELLVEKRFLKLNVEKYGGMLCAPWLDRPLSVAGRVVVRTQDGIQTRLLNIDRDLLLIPNLSIHMNREANKGQEYNPQVDMLPLFAMGEETGGFQALLARDLGVEPEDILDTDLYLYNRMKGTTFGLNQEFIASGRLDDLQCAFASLKGLLAAKPVHSAAVHCVFDNEEVGSCTKQGAVSTFLADTLRRIVLGCGQQDADIAKLLQSSFMVSADNAHSVHPNHGEKADPTNRPVLNGGIVIKYSANQKYTTDAVSGALFREICRRADVPWQTFANRSDMPGGSTLGNLSSAQVPVAAVDVGLPQLAMHSPYETAGSKDTLWLAEAARELFSITVRGRGDGSYRIEGEAKEQGRK